MSAPPPRRGWTQADEDAWQAKYDRQKAAEQQAFEERGGLPPRQSQVNGPPLDWRRWCALLDGFPVEHCYAFDGDAGWVEVYVVDPGRTTCRILDADRRRLHGEVTAVPVAEWNELRKTRERIVITAERLRGDPVPGTALRICRLTPAERAHREAVAAEIRGRMGKEKAE